MPNVVDVLDVEMDDGVLLAVVVDGVDLCCCCPFVCPLVNVLLLLPVGVVPPEELVVVLFVFEPDVAVPLAGVVAVGTALPAVFFHGWNPLPTAASANGGGLLDDSLLHCAANMANGVPLNPGCSCK